MPRTVPHEALGWTRGQWQGEKPDRRAGVWGEEAETRGSTPHTKFACRRSEGRLQLTPTDNADVLRVKNTVTARVKSDAAQRSSRRSTQQTHF